jgi:hypothetical protein
MGISSTCFLDPGVEKPVATVARCWFSNVRLKAWLRAQTFGPLNGPLTSQLFKIEAFDFGYGELSFRVPSLG